MTQYLNKSPGALRPTNASTFGEERCPPRPPLRFEKSFTTIPKFHQNPPPSNILHFNFQTFRFHRNHSLYKLFPPNIQQILTKIDRLRMNRRYMDPNHRTRNAISGSTLLYSYNRCQLVREVLPARQGERAY